MRFPDAVMRYVITNQLDITDEHLHGLLTISHAHSREVERQERASLAAALLNLTAIWNESVKQLVGDLDKPSDVQRTAAAARIVAGSAAESDLDRGSVTPLEIAQQQRLTILREKLLKLADDWVKTAADATTVTLTLNPLSASMCQVLETNVATLAGQLRELVAHELGEP